MKMMYTVLALVLGFFMLMGCAQDNSPTSETQSNSDNEEATEPTEAQGNGEYAVIAQQFIQLLVEENYVEASQQFNETVAAELSPEKLEEVWNSVQQQAGNFIDQEYRSSQEKDGYQVVQISGLFENQDVVFTVTIDSNKEIAGFFIQ